MSTHRCRTGCDAFVERRKAFCRGCWSRVPQRIQTAIYASWRRVMADGGLDTYGAHVELLLDASDALDGNRPWTDVAR